MSLLDDIVDADRLASDLAEKLELVTAQRDACLAACYDIVSMLGYDDCNKYKACVKARKAIALCSPKTRETKEIEKDHTLAIATLTAQRDACLAACRKVVIRYDELWNRMDTEHAAFFTGIGPQVAAARAAIVLCAPPKDTP